MNREHHASDLRLGKWLDGERECERIRTPFKRCSMVHSRRVSELIRNSRREVCSSRLIVISTGGVVRMNLPEVMGIKGADSNH